ncbi:16S rRNA (cytosine(967)-C(5))-methyltransferase [filamentous cyanobacterium LEGE 11480]|uniref:16S rRNA (cytosine(967)-C(5))-methyltransferase n=1 Tax=Romeriopsis navalis LEGE 11480 TaxID=2777977 RepID=A0A928VNH3_9CYAN|nr:16S rRNA (cytosine(967)-C(5))-methyltransferase [Romeriopsis navalis]MBE9029647.1 16S rRNA (cytosine(967)-C(5))-methyltransferase [Romeriopsis navalis LEGE 11480]
MAEQTKTSKKSQSPGPATTARQLALTALKQIQRGAFADVALDRALKHANISPLDRKLSTELVYGIIRRQRTLDAIIDNLATKSANQQPPELRLILHLGLYQLRYLDHIPGSAAVNTTVDLAKQNGFSGLSGFVNGLLRKYDRHPDTALLAADDPVRNIGIQHSYPDWIVQVYLEQFGTEGTEQLCNWLNQPPTIDLRVNTRKITIDTLEAKFQAAEIEVQRLTQLPQALRLIKHAGAIHQLPGFTDGEWIIQDSSAQLVSYLLDPQPGETIVDACAAPGGKTLHIAELMQDQGTVWAIDKTASRLKKIQQNIDRLGLTCIQTKTADSRDIPELINQCDRVLVDAPCSGLGTLNRHADARWRQTPDSVTKLTELQTAILQQAASWVKPGGTIVYATCTLHPQENEAIIQNFLDQNSNWVIDRPENNSGLAPLLTESGWIKVAPHQQQMDGFFMVRLKKA